MALKRVIPVLLIKNEGLVKTVRFKDPTYLGDPINAIRIFNEKEVDELILLDISEGRSDRGPPFEFISRLTTECFIPLTYGGGVRSVSDMAKLFSMGVEKVALNSSAFLDLDLVSSASREFGSQSVCVSIDVRKGFLRSHALYINSGSKVISGAVTHWARQLEQRGAGELIIQSIDRDGTMAGYDVELVRSVAEAVSIPVIACGGASSIRDIEEVLTVGKASAAAAGALFVFHGKHRAVLINYPSRAELSRCLVPV